MQLSALKEVKRTVNGGILTVVQFPVLRAIRVGARIARIAAPVIAGLGGGLDLDDLVSGKIGSALADGNLDLNKAVPGALKALGEKLDPEELVQICQELLQSAYWVDSAGTIKIDMTEPSAIDRVFAGSIPDLFMALRAALEANNFFGLGAIGRLRGALGASGPKSPESLSPT